jgi:hypothetical protein
MDDSTVLDGNLGKNDPISDPNKDWGTLRQPKKMDEILTE